MRGKWEERGSDRGRRAFKTQSRAFFRSFQSDVSSRPDNHFSSLANSLSCLSRSLRLPSKVCFMWPESCYDLWAASLSLWSYLTLLKSHKYVLVFFIFFLVRELRSIYLVLHMLMQICVSVSVRVWEWGSCLHTYSMWIHNAVVLLKLCVF